MPKQPNSSPATWKRHPVCTLASIPAPLLESRVVSKMEEASFLSNAGKHFQYGLEKVKLMSLLWMHCISYRYGRSREPYYSWQCCMLKFVSLCKYKYSDETVWSICSLCITAWNLPTTGRSANSAARTSCWNPGIRSLLPTLDTRAVWSFLAARPCAWSNPPLTIKSWKACGDPPQERKKKHIIKDRRILHAMERYDRETVELVEYLDSLRNIVNI